MLKATKDCKVCLKVLERKLVPLSVCILSGNSKVENNLVRALITAHVVIYHKGIASEN